MSSLYVDGRRKRLAGWGASCWVALRVPLEAEEQAMNKSLLSG